MRVDEVLKEDEGFDLSTRLRQDPRDDKFSQFHEKETKRKPVLTLRHINDLKKKKKAQREEHEKRKLLLNLMYSSPEEAAE